MMRAAGNLEALRRFDVEKRPRNHPQHPGPKRHLFHQASVCARSLVANAIPLPYGPK